MEDADLQMAAVERGITGTFRTLEYTDLTPEDARWIFEKLGNMNSLRVIRGVPSAKKTNGRSGTASNFMTTSTADVEEQSEEFLLGMDVYEYLFVLTATSIDMDVKADTYTRYFNLFSICGVKSGFNACIPSKIRTDALSSFSLLPR